MKGNDSAAGEFILFMHYSCYQQQRRHTVAMLFDGSIGREAGMVDMAVVCLDNNVSLIQMRILRWSLILECLYILSETLNM